jgi:class 3 adenylate cyclase
VGIHTGLVVGGIVGTQKYLYDVFGDTVNTASRMESNSEPMRVNISNATWELVKDDFRTTDRGEHAVKGKDAMHMYFVEGRLSPPIA